MTRNLIAEYIYCFSSGQWEVIPFNIVSTEEAHFDDELLENHLENLWDHENTFHNDTVVHIIPLSIYSAEDDVDVEF